MLSHQCHDYDYMNSETLRNMRSDSDGHSRKDFVYRDNNILISKDNEKRTNISCVAFGKPKLSGKN